MKRQTLFTIALVLITKLLFSQATRTPNTWGLTSDYLGWDATVGSPPLLIKTTNPDAINFQTGAVSRMTILGNTGFVGIGNTSVFTPVRRLHLREGSSNTTYFLMTGNNTGDAITDGLQISHQI